MWDRLVAVAPQGRVTDGDHEYGTAEACALIQTHA
jgi:hypothetical protein